MVIRILVRKVCIFARVELFVNIEFVVRDKVLFSFLFTVWATVRIVAEQYFVTGVRVVDDVRFVARAGIRTRIGLVDRLISSGLF